MTWPPRTSTGWEEGLASKIFVSSLRFVTSEIAQNPNANDAGILNST